MTTYEIRVIRQGNAAVYNAPLLNDHAAIRRARLLAQDGDSVEVWRGLHCVFTHTPSICACIREGRGMFAPFGSFPVTDPGRPDHSDYQMDWMGWHGAERIRMWLCEWQDDHAAESEAVAAPEAKDAAPAPALSRGWH